MPGSIAGTIVDIKGDELVGANVRLSLEGHIPDQESVSNQDGRFSFTNVPPGDFKLTVTAKGFTTRQQPGTLHPGESYEAPGIVLVIAPATTEVRVEVTQTELAEEQIQIQEKQRVLGVIPNFYVSYVHDAVPLAPKQKFELAWKTAFDPVSFVIVGAVAGVGQATDGFNEYGQGAQGYAKRYGAAYGDFFTGTMLGGAFFPIVLKQDPRYFYKGTGGTRSRVLYAMANVVICKGDNGRWQPNYSSILGSLASGGISNLYYPADDRGAAFTFQNALVNMAEGAAVNVVQEFIMRKLTPNLPPPSPAPSSTKGE
jgi:hypothetical protein